jgi:serine phosphatase RsbU (regulator of sigma subunit)
LLISPLKVKEKIIGVINMADKPFHKSYSSGDMKLLASISSQAALSIYNSMLIRELKENERIQKEMEIAEAVQKNLLPAKAPEISGIDLAGRCLSAKRVGGDYYDFFPTPGEGGLGIVIADISGHSVSAAIMMAITRGLLQSEAIRNNGPATLLADVNRLLFHDLESSELFITMIYASYCPKRRSISLSNGGHNPPLLFRARSKRPEFLESDGMAIGFLPEVAFEERRLRLHRGDLLVLYTDGIIEAEDPHGNPFGMDRFISLLAKNRGRSSGDVLEKSYQAVLKYIGQDDPHHVQEDDITLVVMKVL